MGVRWRNGAKSTGRQVFCDRLGTTVNLGCNDLVRNDILFITISNSGNRFPLLDKLSIPFQEICGHFFRVIYSHLHIYK